MSRVTTLLNHANIYTQDPNMPRATAIALADNRILAVGNDLDHLIGPETAVIDMAGQTVLPGFIDAHIHFVGWALQRHEVDLQGTLDRQQVLERVAAKVKATKPDRWVRGGGWDANLWPEGPPSREMLDRVAANNPVALDSKDWHSLWVNSAALALAGISADTPDPEGGLIERDPQTGKPTGVLRENAVRLLDAVIEPPSLSECCEAARAGFAQAWTAGLTGIQEANDTPDMRSLRTFQALQRGGELGLRVTQNLPRERLQAAVDLGLRSGFGNDWLRIGGIKFFADGALGSRTAWMLAPYQDSDNWYGVSTLDPEVFTEEALRASAAGISVMVHAIGDRANRQVLDALEIVRRAEPEWLAGRALPERPWLPLRHRIEHVQIIHTDDVLRLARAGIIASVQPIHAPSDMLNAERHWGGSRLQGAYAFRSLLDSGATLAFGSDAPVESFNVLQGISAAVTRQRNDGSPGSQGWIPEQRISVAEAVRAYTVGAAYASGEENLKGTLRAGMLADLVVLSADIYQCPPADIRQISVRATMLDGNVVHGTLHS